MLKFLFGLCLCLILCETSFAQGFQCLNCMTPKTANYPQQVLVPQVVQVPYTLQGTQYIPPQPPRWVLGQWWVQRRQAARTIPGRVVPIYTQQQSAASAQ